jgi:hypothetical protein
MAYGRQSRAGRDLSRYTRQSRRRFLVYQQGEKWRGIGRPRRCQQCMIPESAHPRGSARMHWMGRRQRPCARSSLMLKYEWVSKGVLSRLIGSRGVRFSPRPPPPWSANCCREGPSFCGPSWYQITRLISLPIVLLSHVSRQEVHRLSCQVTSVLRVSCL